MRPEIPDAVARLTTTTPPATALTGSARGQRFGALDRVDPTVGQVWRASWGTVSRVVLLLAPQVRAWTVVPVSIEPTGEDEQSLVVSPDCTAFGVEVTVWLGLAATIPAGSLTTVVDAWTDELVTWCRGAPHPDGTPSPPGTRRGTAPAEPWGADAAVRADLADDLDALTRTPLVPTTTPDSRALKAAARSVGLRAVVDALGVNQQEALQIVDGRRPPSTAQAAALADLFDIPVEDVQKAAGGLPPELAAELERPVWRSVWRAMARRTGVTEAQARLHAGFGTLQMSFRQTGGPAVPDWHARLGQWLDTQEQQDGGR